MKTAYLILALSISSLAQARQVNVEVGNNVKVQAPGVNITVQNSNQAKGQNNGKPTLNDSAQNKVQNTHLSGNELQRQLACEAKPVKIEGNENKLELLGNCPLVEVIGNDNQIKVEQLGKLKVLGNDNQVRWRVASNGKVPEVKSSGNDNQVSKQ